MVFKASVQSVSFCKIQKWYDSLCLKNNQIHPGSSNFCVTRRKYPV